LAREKPEILPYRPGPLPSKVGEGQWEKMPLKNLHPSDVRIWSFFVSLIIARLYTAKLDEGSLNGLLRLLYGCPGFFYAADVSAKFREDTMEVGGAEC